MKIESAIQVLSQILGSRDEVVAVISEMLEGNMHNVYRLHMLKTSLVLVSSSHSIKRNLKNSDDTYAKLKATSKKFNYRVALVS